MTEIPGYNCRLFNSQNKHLFSVHSTALAATNTKDSMMHLGTKEQCRGTVICDIGTGKLGRLLKSSF